MRRFAFVLLALSTQVAAGQEPSTQLPTGSQFPDEGAPLRPAEVVAQMARQAMGLPSDPTGWQALAEALPEMALLGGADLESTFDAARIADSLSAVTATGPVQPAQAEWASSAVTLILDRWKDLALALLAAAAGTFGMLTIRRRRTRTKLPSKGSRVIAARSLVDSGLPAYEIARRTGMAQDAVHVLLSVSLSGKAPLPPKAQEPGTRQGRRARSVAPAVIDRADLEREARLAARRLRDKRLTYGPGATA